jgi:hypothetical protein
MRSMSDRRMRVRRTASAGLGVVVGIGLLAPAALASHPVASYRLHHPKHEHCLAHYVRKVEKAKRREHGHTVKVRETVCVYVPPKPSIGVLPSITAKPVTTVAPAATTAIPAPSFTFHAKLDPSFTQDAANPLDVTYDYSASADKLTNGVSLGEPDLPSGVLELYNEGLLACSMNVGGSTGEGECPVAYSSYGEHTVVVLYLSGEASATSGNETERIEPPAVTDRESWQPTSASMTITRSTAQVIVSGDFHGATHVGLADNLGDSCEATVTASEATCTMPVTGEPSSLTVAYPGGSTTSHVEAVAPGGERVVTEEWPADSPQIVPTVIAYRATVEWSGWSKHNSSGTGAPPNPVEVDVGESLTLGVNAIGNFHGDETALGYISYTIEGPGAFTTHNDLYGINPEHPGSEDCSEVHNYSLQAVADCGLTFSELGTYTVSVIFVSEDPNYADTAGPSVTVDVTG